MNPILEKIKKLLRMKHGGTQAEVETALAMAAELARKHGIDLATVNPDETPAEEISHVDAFMATRLQWECKYSALVVENFFGVSFLCRTKGYANSRGWAFKINYSITFVGTASATEIAIYIYHFLVGHFRRCWSRASGRLRDRRSFMYGMFLGLSRKLQQERQRVQAAEPALVLVSRELARQKTYMEKTFGKLTSESTEPDTRSTAAAYAGYVEGLKTNIRPALQSATPVQPQLALPAH
jgi:hypothetical protein